MTEVVDSLRFQVAKAIQSDNEGKEYFITEQGLTEFLVAVLEADQEEALKVAKEILKDRNGAQYYYFEPGGPETLSGRLRGIGKRNR